MTDKAIKTEEKVKHDNIYAALSAFQGENPEIKRTKHVSIQLKAKDGSLGRKLEYDYAPLDEFVSTIRPLLAKHGLSFTHEMASEGKIQCVLYHETYESAKEIITTSFQKIGEENKDGTVTKEVLKEKNVIRSMPITVLRSGDMKDIGGDSTYARRYTLAEITGCASDEDKDAPLEVESAKNAVKTVFTSFKDKISKGTKKEVEDRIHIINDELDLIEAKKAPKLGLTEEQYTELGNLAQSRLAGLAVKEDVINTGDPE